MAVRERQVKSYCKLCKEPTDNIAYCNECVHQAKEFVRDTIADVADWMATDEKNALELINIALLEITRESKWTSY